MLILTHLTTQWDQTLLTNIDISTRFCLSILQINSYPAF